MLTQHALDGAAQQSRIVARHRRDDQQARPPLDTFTAEVLELAEGLFEDHFLAHEHILARYLHHLDPEFGFAAWCGGVSEDIERRGYDRAHAAVSEWICRVLHPPGAYVREGTGSGEQRTLHFIGVVEHHFS